MRQESAPSNKDLSQRQAWTLTDQSQVVRLLLVSIFDSIKTIRPKLNLNVTVIIHVLPNCPRASAAISEKPRDYASSKSSDIFSWRFSDTLSGTISRSATEVIGAH